MKSILLIVTIFSCFGCIVSQDVANPGQFSNLILISFLVLKFYKKFYNSWNKKTLKKFVYSYLNTFN